MFDMSKQPENTSAAAPARAASRPAHVWSDGRELVVADPGMTLEDLRAVERAARRARLARARERGPYALAALAMNAHKQPRRWLEVAGPYALAWDFDGTARPALASTEDEPQTPPGRPGASDHHPEPGPAHPRTAAHTLLAAPGAPSATGRAAA